MSSNSNETPQIALTEQVQCASSQNASQSGAQGTAFPTVIPAVKSSGSPRAGRTLVICLDGTGDTFNNDNSNVIKFVACLKKDDPNQITYYQSGIGTYDGQGRVKKGMSAAFDMAVCFFSLHFELFAICSISMFQDEVMLILTILVCRLAVASGFITKRHIVF
jgi:hypothetical protein